MFDILFSWYYGVIQQEEINESKIHLTELISYFFSKHA